MNVQDQTLAREGLSRLSTDTLLRGMRAFNHPPRTNYQRVDGDDCGCFCAAAFDADAPEFPELAYYPMCRAVGRDAEGALSLAYEEYTDWLRGECVRELAERGVALEPAVVSGVRVPHHETEPPE